MERAAGAEQEAFSERRSQELGVGSAGAAAGWGPQLEEQTEEQLKA